MLGKAYVVTFIVLCLLVLAAIVWLGLVTGTLVAMGWVLSGVVVVAIVSRLVGG